MTGPFAACDVLMPQYRRCVATGSHSPPLAAAAAAAELPHCLADWAPFSSRELACST
jgi:hypothetical protein